MPLAAMIHAQMEPELKLTCAVYSGHRIHGQAAMFSL